MPARPSWWEHSRPCAAEAFSGGGSYVSISGPKRTTLGPVKIWFDTSGSTGSHNLPLLGLPVLSRRCLDGVRAAARPDVM